MQQGRGSGGKCTDSSESSDRVGLLLRMSLLSELEVLTGFSLHWEPWDTKSNLGGYQLKRSEPATSASEFGLWPTCRASDAEHGGPNQKDSKGNPALPAAVHHWPTPTASLEAPAAWKEGVQWWRQPRSARNLEAIVNWSTPTATEWKRDLSAGTMKRKSPPLATQVNCPTPTATEYGSNQGGANGRTGPTRPSISRLVQDSNNTTGKNQERLNPKWVLQLMGYPANWLSVPSAMQSSPRFRMQLQEPYKESKELSRRNRFSK